ncbi:MAG: N-acetylmuramoyl-L-alanine amidase [Myxococcota bacterium]
MDLSLHLGVPGQQPGRRSLILLLGALLGCAEPPLETPTPTPTLSSLELRSMELEVALARWPHPDARLASIHATFPDEFGVRRVFVDAGHGARGNPGNNSSLCDSEQDVMLMLSQSLAQALDATGHFDVRISRSGDARVPYRRRLNDAAEWGAEVFLSLHSDARGSYRMWSPSPGRWCPRSDDAPGFSVLWSDEGDAVMAGQRQALAGAVATMMRRAGFLPYDGADYVGLYGGDPAQPGAFVDRHQPRSRIMFLRRPRMPSIIIETHHALDPQAARRWREAETQSAFHAAVIAALVEWFSPDTFRP